MEAAVLMIFMAIAAAAGVVAMRREEEQDFTPQTRKAWARAIAYWVFTIPVAFEMAAGGLWDLSRIEYVRVILTQLGYPLYLLYIIGVPRIPCAFVLLVPRFPRLKEWAYAGAFFNYAGAAASHLLAGSRGSQWVGPLALAGFTIASWSLRPKTRRLPEATTVSVTRPTAWWVPTLIGVAMLVMAFLTLPKGAPPQ
jgi:hypothetical protein